MPHGEIDRNALSLLVNHISPFTPEHSVFAGSIPHPSTYIETALDYYPIPLCVKNVHAAMVILTGNGIVEMYGRNGIVNGSPAQLEQFSAGNLSSLTNKKTDQRIRTFLRSEASSSWVIGCRTLAQMTNSARCIKEHVWPDIPDDKLNIDTKPEPRPAEEACPNSRAKACTERLFLNIWLPYVIELQNRLKEEGELQQDDKLIIKQVLFKKEDAYPIIEYAVGSKMHEGFQLRSRCYPATGEEQLAAIQKILLITQYAPCKDCAKDIVSHKLNDRLEIYMVALSRHIGIGFQPKIGLDGDDIDALAMLFNQKRHPIPVFYDDIEHARLVWRQNLE